MQTLLAGVPQPAGLDPGEKWLTVGVDRWVSLVLHRKDGDEPFLSNDGATVMLSDTDLTPEVAEAIAAKLIGAARLARQQGQ